MIQAVSLGDEIELLYGKGLPQRDRVKGCYPVYGSNGQVDTHNKSLIAGPGIIVGRKGSVGEVIWTDDDFWPIDTTYYVKLKNKEDSLKYWYYQLKILGLSQLNSHSAIPGLNRDVAYSQQVIQRTPDEQKKIAEILGTLDEKIELNRQMNETLEQIGQALFRHYFIDNPEAEKWEVGHFSDVANVMTGKGSVKSQMSDDGVIPLYGANGIMGTSKDYLYDEPLIITGRVGTLGVVKSVVGKSWFSDNVIIMQPKNGYFGYVYYLAKSFDYVSMNRGSSQPLITQTDIKNIAISVPDIDVLNKFEIENDDIFNQIQNNSKEIQTLISLRDTLLPRLISGKI
jgi:type I restriction enzyme, S subunit